MPTKPQSALPEAHWHNAWRGIRRILLTQTFCPDFAKNKKVDIKNQLHQLVSTCRVAFAGGERHLCMQRLPYLHTRPPTSHDMVIDITRVAFCVMGKTVRSRKTDRSRVGRPPAFDPDPGAVSRIEYSELGFRSDVHSSPCPESLRPAAADPANRYGQQEGKGMHGNIGSPV